MSVALQLQLTQSKHGPHLRIDVSGKVGRDVVRGYTQTINVGLYPLDSRAIDDRLTLNRENGGTAPTYAMRRKVVDAIVARVLSWATEHGIEVPDV